MLKNSKEKNDCQGFARLYNKKAGIYIEKCILFDIMKQQ